MHDTLLHDTVVHDTVFLRCLDVKYFERTLDVYMYIWDMQNARLSISKYSGGTPWRSQIYYRLMSSRGSWLPCGPCD